MEKLGPIRVQFLFAAVPAVCAVFINVICLVKTLLYFACINGFPSLNKSLILEFVKFRIQTRMREKNFGTGEESENVTPRDHF